MNPIAVKIREERLKSGMTEKMLAKKCGLSENYIKQVESGKKVINEQAAQKMLQVLGAETEILQQGSYVEGSAEDRSPSPLKKKNREPEGETTHSIEPNSQWSGALAHIIKRFPVEDLATGKIIGHKELPLLGKKIDGCPWECLRFFRVKENQLQHLRIYRDDIVTVWEKTDIRNGKLYAVEVNGQRLIRKLSRDQSKKVSISTGAQGESPVILQEAQVKVIGECVKVEFFL